jgi:hypothetical protein
MSWRVLKQWNIILKNLANEDIMESVAYGRSRGQVGMHCSLKSIVCQAYYQPEKRFCFLQRLDNYKGKLHSDTIRKYYHF